MNNIVTILIISICCGHIANTQNSLAVFKPKDDGGGKCDYYGDDEIISLYGSLVDTHLIEDSLFLVLKECYSEKIIAISKNLELFLVDTNIVICDRYKREVKTLYDYIVEFQVGDICSESDLDQICINACIYVNTGDNFIPLTEYVYRSIITECQHFPNGEEFNYCGPNVVICCRSSTYRESIITPYLNTNNLYISKIYPNPVKDILLIDLDRIYRNDEIRFSIFSINGNIIFKKQLIPNFKNVLRVDLSSFKKGIYIININTNELDRKFKIIKI